ncbi:MAG: hypothetical protein OXG56_09710 [Gammaproteobacteria bacterium]|nr:hypothetical protein [Gammaproteobacteria bacterium]
MNRIKLKQAETDFLLHYPGGFNHPELVALRNRHKIGKMVEMTRDCLGKHRFERPDVMIEDLIRIIGRSSMVSRFEKPKFKHFLHSMSPLEREWLVDGVQEHLYGNERQGFEQVTEILQTGKLAKWSLLSIYPFYCRPEWDVFVKPTTVKGIIQRLELKGLPYAPLPAWEFYETFRDQINRMKREVDPSLSPNNAAFTGFLMMSL